MSKQRTIPTLDTLTSDVAELSRDLWLAGLGALATVEEEGTRFYDDLLQRRNKLEKDGRKRLDDLQTEATKMFNELVTRGKKVETKGRKQLTAQVEAVKSEVAAVRKDLTGRQQELTGKVEQVTDRLEHRVVGTVETVMERLEVPTRTEVKELARKVDLLAGKVNKLATLLAQPAVSAKVYHLVPQEDGWAVKLEGGERAIERFDTKAEALDRARELAGNQAPSRLVVHRKDGTIQDQFSYDA